ncbi:MAG: hypothetical protein IK106_01910 [Clostridiales bacterium]|nr:hypothetical protein [Clostridiales bacterium]
MDAKKRKYIARISFDKKEAEFLSYRYSPGQLVLWCVLAGKQSLGIWLIAPDFTSADTISFNIIDNDMKFEESCDICVGDTLKLSASLPDNAIKDIEIVAVRKCKPLYVRSDHNPPASIEEAMKTVDDVKIDRPTFRLHGLPFVTDKTRQVVITSDKGDVWKFPYRTNKVFYIDEKRFFMLLESQHRPMLAVSAFLSKNAKYEYRMKMSDWPDVLNYFFTSDAELSDCEGITYQVSIEEKAGT